jgi:hypothetical protein
MMTVDALGGEHLVSHSVNISVSRLSHNSCDIF